MRVDYLLVLAAGLAFLFGWNNSSFLIGNLRGSGSISTAAALVITVCGLLAGVFLSGKGMFKSLNGELSPSMPAEGLAAMFAVSIGITLALSVAALPVSFTMAMTGSFAGAAVSLGTGVRLAQLSKIVGFWFIAPLLTAILAAALYTGLRRVLKTRGLITMDTVSRVGVVVVSAFVAYSIGANNMGLIFGTAGGSLAGPRGVLAILGVVAAAVLGVLIFGSGRVSKNLGDRAFGLSPLAVLATFTASALSVLIGVSFHVPVSMGQCVLGGMLGAAYSRKPSFVNGHALTKITSMWVLVPSFSFLVTYSVFAPH
ncbi:MAG: inorganic phosphate transporter [Candidatus Marsarchaeota archaeon]|nr:inorganic phosphate transporter [Candidatus Marsarchaeota archaeon]